LVTLEQAENAAMNDISSTLVHMNEDGEIRARLLTPTIWYVARNKQGEGKSCSTVREALCFLNPTLK